jgi:hypothetical protein
MKKLRIRLIRWLAGDMMVVINCKVNGSDSAIRNGNTRTLYIADSIIYDGASVGHIKEIT